MLLLAGSTTKIHWGIATPYWIIMLLAGWLLGAGDKDAQKAPDGPENQPVNQHSDER
jgi:hypothetical protein